jgi:hypothetical protein
LPGLDLRGHGAEFGFVEFDLGQRHRWVMRKYWRGACRTWVSGRLLATVLSISFDGLGGR